MFSVGSMVYMRPRDVGERGEGGEPILLVFLFLHSFVVRAPLLRVLETSTICVYS